MATKHTLLSYQLKFQHAAHLITHSFSSENSGTPGLLKHHQKQLTHLGVQFGRGNFEIYDVHTRRDLKLLLPSGTSYNGGLDGVAAPWGLAKAGAISEMRIAYEHKQSAAPKRLYREAHPEAFEVDLLLLQISCAWKALPLPHRTADFFVCSLGG